MMKLFHITESTLGPIVADFGSFDSMYGMAAAGCMNTRCGIAAHWAKHGEDNRPQNTAFQQAADSFCKKPQSARCTHASLTFASILLVEEKAANKFEKAEMKTTLSIF